MAKRQYDVFLSYGRAEEAVVARIALWLQEQRVDTWWDRRALVPGGRWQEEIAEGLRASRACAVFVGPTGLADWAREELAVAQDLAAKDRSFRLFMVLLPGAPELSDPGVAFLRLRQRVDLRAGFDKDGQQDLVAAITGTPRRFELLAANTDICPYRGLEAFEEEHAEFFFGRENDVALVLDKLKASRFLAVLGPSGSGKSSLLRAGLVPAVCRSALIDSQSWTVRFFSPGLRPLSSLAAQMRNVFYETTTQQKDFQPESDEHGLGPAASAALLDRLHKDARTLDQVASIGLGGRPVAERVLLVIDQFEALFTDCKDGEEQAAFLANLVYAATIPGGRVVVVIGMRADFYHRCIAFPDLRMLVADQQYLLGPLSAEGLIRAIDEPARRVGLELEPGLTETIRRDVEARPGSLPLLEHVLLEIWRRRRGTMLTLDAYVVSGGVEGALAQRANSVYTKLSEVQRKIAKRVLLRLVQPGDGADDTRRRAHIAELLTGSDEELEVQTVIRALADQRLITTGRDEVSGERSVDITHEALIRGWPELRRWVAEDREAIRQQRHLTQAATEWDRRSRHDDDLFSGARLIYWQERATGELSNLESAFLSASIREEARTKAAGRLRARLTIGGVVIGLSVVAIVALVGLRNVAAERDLARSRQLASDSTVSLAADPARAVRLAMEAYGIRPTSEAQRALRAAVATPGSRVTSLSGHEGKTSIATFSPDGRRVVTGDEDTVRVWDWASGDEPRMLKGHRGQIISATFSPDGRFVVSSGGDGTVRVWDWAGGRELAMFRGGDERFQATAIFSPDGRRVLSADTGGTIWLWDWMGGSGTITLTGHTRSVSSIEFDTTGVFLLVAGGTFVDSIWVWNLVSLKEVAFLPGQAKPLSSATFSHDGKRIVTAGSDLTIRVWDWQTQTPPILLRPEAPPMRVTPYNRVGRTEGLVYSASFSPDDTHLVSTTDEGVQVWDLVKSDRPVVLRGQAEVMNASFSQDGRRVLSTGDETIRIWDWASGAQPTVLRGHRGKVSNVAFDPDGLRILSTGNDGTVRVWDWTSGGEPNQWRGHEGNVTSVAFSPDGRHIASAGIDDTVRVWDSAGREEPTVLRGHTDEVTSVAFSPDGRRVVSGSRDGTTRVWDWPAAHQPTVLGGHSGSVFAVAFSPDGLHVASGDGKTLREEGTVRVWDLASGSDPIVLRVERPVSSVAFSSDGRWLVNTVLFSGPVRVWDWAAGREVGRLEGDFGSFAEFSPGGDRIITSTGRDDAVIVLNWRSGAKPLILRTPGRIPASGGFSRDGLRLLVAYLDGSIGVWDSAREDGPTMLGGLSQSVNRAAFSSDDGKVALAVADGTVQVRICLVCEPVEDLQDLFRHQVSS